MRNKHTECSCIGNLYNTVKAGKAFVYNENSLNDPIYTNRPYALSYILKHNKQMSISGKIIDINPSKTVSAFSNKRPDNYKNILERLKNEASFERDAVGLGYDDSYLEMLNRGILKPKMKSDYIKWLELTIIKLEAQKPSEHEEAVIIDVDEEFESLKVEAKEAGISLRGVTTKETLKNKLEEYKSNQN